MTWQARGGGGGAYRGGGLGGGGGFGGFGGGFTPFGKQLAIVLTVCFVSELFAVFWLGLGDLTEWLILWPVDSGHWAPWQLVTYPFFGNLGLFGFLFTILALFFFADTTERYFGTGRFQTFLVVVVLVSGLCGSVLSALLPLDGASYGGFTAPMVALICAFGWLNPHATILLFFVLPVRAVWITYFTIVLEVFGFLTKNPYSLYHLPAIGIAYLTIQRGVRLPDWRRKWLQMKEKRLKRRLKKFDVIQGGGNKKKSSNGAPDEPKEWLH